MQVIILCTSGISRRLSVVQIVALKMSDWKMNEGLEILLQKNSNNREHLVRREEML